MLTKFKMSHEQIHDQIWTQIDEKVLRQLTGYLLEQVMFHVEDPVCDQILKRLESQLGCRFRYAY